jgi:pimeloyl-ACP methyl ester carboxylesterase
MERPEIRYAKTVDGLNIAYAVVGDGPLDLVHVPAFASHVEMVWEEPSLARSYSRLASFSRTIFLDKRGTGLSDRVDPLSPATLEQRMDDIRAVMDAVGAERAVLYGMSEGAAMSVLFAATYPERVEALVLYGAVMRNLFANLDEAAVESVLDGFEKMPGEDSIALLAPSRADDVKLKEWWGRYTRASASPGSIRALLRMNMKMDVRHVLPVLHVPTLVVHRTGDRVAPVEHVREDALLIPDVKYVELPGEDHLLIDANAGAIFDEIEEFVTGSRPVHEPDRVLATVLFTDIVGSTERAAELGDSRWTSLLEEYYGAARRELERFRGREIKTTGDGFLATFDGPARGVRCAQSMGAAAGPLGLSIRAGLHTGECELMENDVGGIAVHIGARVMAEAGSGEVLVSSTVKDLVAGSGLEFEDRGSHRLKGLPDEWRLYAVKGGN